MIKAATAVHRALLRLTGNRVGGSFRGARIVLVTTKGRKSGRPRTVPLMSFDEGDAMVLVASNAGDDYHPGWFHNLMANPKATVELRGSRRRVTARKATPEERERLWPRVVSIYDGYDEYTRRTTREIPLVILTPLSKRPAR
jgi:deazaflavin-dependent oxidoreductase (nitroreductase family)